MTRDKFSPTPYHIHSDHLTSYLHMPILHNPVFYLSNLNFQKHFCNFMVLLYIKPNQLCKPSMLNLPSLHLWQVLRHMCIRLWSFVELDLQN